MTDNEPQGGSNSGDKPLGLTRPGRLELKKTVESGQVRQSFSHGRTKTVQVEKKKKRTFKRTQTGNMAEVPEIGIGNPLLPKGAREEGEESAAVARQLTEKERATRARAVEERRRGVSDSAAG